MRLKNFLNEDYKNFEDFDEAVDFMEKNCKPFLKAKRNLNPDDFLYRGIRGVPYDIFMRDVRKNRQPLSTKREKHLELDKLFYEKFGIKARSQSLFCTSSPSDAKSYGPAWIIFPIGEYKILWSPEVVDLFVYLTQHPSKPLKEVVSLYRMGGLKDAIKSGNEIMVSCDRYLAFIYMQHYMNLYLYFKK